MVGGEGDVLERVATAVSGYVKPWGHSGKPACMCVNMWKSKKSMCASRGGVLVAKLICVCVQGKPDICVRTGLRMACVCRVRIWSPPTASPFASSRTRMLKKM